MNQKNPSSNHLYENQVAFVNIPIQNERSGTKAPTQTVLEGSIPNKLAKQILMITKGCLHDTYALYSAAMHFLLYKLAGEASISHGMPASICNAEAEAADKLFLINTEIDINIPCRDFIDRVKKKISLVSDKQGYYDKGISYSTGLPLIILMRDMHMTTGSWTKKEGVIIKFSISGSCLRFSCRYEESLYDNAWMKRIFNTYFMNVIHAFIYRPDDPLVDIDILNHGEKEQLLHYFNKPIDTSDSNIMYISLFIDQALRMPDATAVIYDGIAWSYKELLHKVDVYASFLLTVGSKGSVIALACNRNNYMLAMILAIFKTGRVYLPIDIEYPENRILYMLKNAGVQVVLSEKACKAEWQNKFCTYYRDDIIFDNGQCITCDEAGTPGDIAYIMYTSGSSGFPKGVIVEHGGMLNHIKAKINDLGLSEGSLVAQNATQCFVISIWQFLAPLIVGGTTVIYPPSIVQDPHLFITSLIKDKINILEVVPSYLTAMLDYMRNHSVSFQDLSFMIITGEKVKMDLVKDYFFICKGVPLVNAYGQTEASDDITHYIMTQMPEGDTVPIGKPLENTRIYIVDGTQHLCPVGIVGEIWVSGIGVGRGYINNLEETKQRFSYNPFLQDGFRLYKTGDMGIWMKEGLIEYKGRKDHQVKIRGFRIELEEVEHHISRFPDIKEVVVLDIEGENHGERVLCAYYTSDTVININAINRFVSESLMQYMVPSRYIQVESIPLTLNGKIDRNSLSGIKGSLEQKNSEISFNQTEECIARIWHNVLNINISSKEDNFFELGGHSLNAVAVAMRIYKELGVRIQVSDVFHYPLLSQLASRIQELGDSKDSGINYFI